MVIATRHPNGALELDYSDGRGWVDSRPRVGYDVDMPVLDTELPKDGALIAVETGTETSTDTIDITVSIPTETAVALKHATGGKLDIASAASMVLQLYATAPLDRAAKTLTSTQHARICEALGFSPQTVDELVSGIEELTRISFGGLRVRFTAEEIGIINARNATGLPAREWAEHIVRLGFEAWRNGVIG